MADPPRRWRARGPGRRRAATATAAGPSTTTLSTATERGARNWRGAACQGGGPPRPRTEPVGRRRGRPPAPDRGRAMRTCPAAAVLGAALATMRGLAALLERHRRDRLRPRPPAPKGTFCQVVLAGRDRPPGVGIHSQPGQPGRRRRGRPSPLLLPGLGTGSTPSPPALTRPPTGRLPRSRAASTRPRLRFPSDAGDRQGRGGQAAGTGLLVVPPSKMPGCSCPTNKLPPSPIARFDQLRGELGAAGGAPGLRPPDRAGYAPRSSPGRDGGPLRARGRAGSTSTSGLRPRCRPPGWRGPSPGRIEVRRFHIHLPVAAPAPRAPLGLHRVVAVDMAVADGGSGASSRVHSGSTPSWPRWPSRCAPGSSRMTRPTPPSATALSTATTRSRPRARSSAAGAATGR